MTDAQVQALMAGMLILCLTGLVAAGIIWNLDDEDKEDKR